MTHQTTDQDTPYHGLTKPAFEADPWDHDYYDLLDKIDDELILKDTIANRPSSPPTDSWFLATDEDILYYYDGSWRVIAGSDIQSSSDIDHDSTTGGTDSDAHHNQNHDNTDHTTNYLPEANYNPEADTHSRYTDAEARSAVDNSNVSVGYADNAGDADTVDGLHTNDIRRQSPARDVNDNILIHTNHSSNHDDTSNIDVTNSNNGSFTIDTSGFIIANVAFQVDMGFGQDSDVNIDWTFDLNSSHETQSISFTQQYAEQYTSNRVEIWVATDAEITVDYSWSYTMDGSGTQPEPVTIEARYVDREQRWEEYIV